MVQSTEASARTLPGGSTTAALSRLPLPCLALDGQICEAIASLSDAHRASCGTTCGVVSHLGDGGDRTGRRRNVLEDVPDAGAETR